MANFLFLHSKSKQIFSLELSFSENKYFGAGAATPA
jgi:hypothetical protein